MRKTLTAVFVAIALFAAPVAADAQTPGSIGSWISGIFGWHAPWTKSVSSLFEARKDNVETGAVERDQLLIRRALPAPVDATSTGLAFAETASSSPLSPERFDSEKSSISDRLDAALNGLVISRERISGFVSSSTISVGEQALIQSDLVVADGQISAAQDSVASFESFDPQPDPSTGMIDPTEAEGYLDQAVSAIETARKALQDVIDLAGAAMADPSAQ